MSIIILDPPPEEEDPPEEEEGAGRTASSGAAFVYSSRSRAGLQAARAHIVTLIDRLDALAKATR